MVRAGRVGKGSSKNVVYRKLVSHQWLEAVDPQHRYGNYLKPYHVFWRQSPSKESFLPWLNCGEGKEMNLVEPCPRLKLHQQRVKYLSPTEREAYEVLGEDGKFRNKKINQLIDTDGDAKWIFVLITSRTLYVGKKKKGVFHHSSFLAGGAVSAGGGVAVENGILKAISRQSGDYRPTKENFEYFVAFLEENSMSSLDEADVNQPKMGLQKNCSQADLTQLLELDQGVKTLYKVKSKTFRGLNKKIFIRSDSRQ